ncbi:MAG: aspartate/glutamate racemase family protein [Calditrichia bacterium]
MKKLGLVGGLSWVSTVEYYRNINEGINARLGGLNFAELILYSLNFGELQARGWGNAFPLLLNACESLQSSGAEGLMLCANTAHLYAEKLQAEINVPLISIVSETATAIQKAELKRVGLLGTAFTMEADFFKDGLSAAGIEAIVPAEQKTRDYIQHTLKEELGRGILKTETKAAYLKIVDELVEDGVECIAFACTEIPLLLSQGDVSVPVFDTLQIHVGAAVDFALAS